MQNFFCLLFMPLDLFIACICRLHPDISGTKFLPFDLGLTIITHKPFVQQDLFPRRHLSGMRLGCSRDWRMFPWRSSYRDRQLVVKLASHSFTWSPPFFARSAEPTARKAPAPAAPDFGGLEESWQATPHKWIRLCSHCCSSLTGYLNFRLDPDCWVKKLCYYALNL